MKQKIVISLFDAEDDEDDFVFGMEDMKQMSLPIADGGYGIRDQVLGSSVWSYCLNKWIYVDTILCDYKYSNNNIQGWKSTYKIIIMFYDIHIYLYI